MLLHAGLLHDRILLSTTSRTQGYCKDICIGMYRIQERDAKQNPKRKLAGALAYVVVGDLRNHAGDVVPEGFSIRLCLCCQSLCNFLQQIKQVSTFARLWEPLEAATD